MKRKNLFRLLFIVVVLFSMNACTINFNPYGQEKPVCDCECECEENEPEQSDKDYVGKTFTKTYNINHVAESNNYEYRYITIRGFQEEEIETVKVKRDQFEDAQAGDNYEITFKVKENGIEDNIKSIFEHTEIVKASKTDKTGLEQTNEDFYD